MRKRIILVLMIFVLLFSSCGKEEEYYNREIYAMDTVVTISIPTSVKKSEKYCNDAVRYINELEWELSATVSESTLSKLNTTAQTMVLEGSLLEVIRYAVDISQKTEGAFDPTCYTLTELWDISNGGYSPTPNEVAMALSYVDYKALILEDNTLSKTSAVRVDLGGIAKGYALEKTVYMLSENVPYGMVSFGGNVGVWGEKPDGTAWEVGIKDPFNTEKTVGKMILPHLGGYVSVSGDYERYFEKDGQRFHHIFDPKTGYPVDNGIHSVAVYCKDATVGDALSTALFVMGYDKAISFYESGIYEFEALFVTDDGIKMTKGMEEMFVNEN